MTYSGFWRRIIAYHIDIVVVLPVVMIFGFFGAGSQSLAVILVPFKGFAFLVYTFYYHGRYGQTLGKRWLRIKVLTTAGEPIGFIGSARRCIIMAAESIPWVAAGMVAIPRVPADQYYALHGHEYTLLEKSFYPAWYPLCLWIVGAIVVAELISMFITARKQSLHDLIASTIVVRVAQQSVPGQAPASRGPP
jgi:uncharacterized RDD family membrane protein YckC